MFDDRFNPVSTIVSNQFGAIKEFQVEDINDNMAQILSQFVLFPGELTIAKGTLRSGVSISRFNYFHAIVIVALGAVNAHRIDSIFRLLLLNFKYFIDEIVSVIFSVNEVVAVVQFLGTSNLFTDAFVCACIDSYHRRVCAHQIGNIDVVAASSRIDIQSFQLIRLHCRGGVTLGPINNGLVLSLGHRW